ncbi:4-hydroxybenzoate polyprenyl transferase [Bradyrhizobium sp. LM4.3]
MNDTSARVADSTGNWVDTRAPQWARPYLRLSRFDRPIGSWLLLMPCWWSAALAAGMAHDVGRLPLTIVLFFVGAFVMRGAGCTWNDITDRDLDDKVERTRSRPLPSGQVSAKQALAFMVAQALIGLVVLLQFNRFAILTGVASLLIVAIYPFMKRITWWPQTVLGLAFSWGALMGFAVTFGRIDVTALVLYAGAISWVIGYDTIYAHQDAEDDALIGIKSTARPVRRPYAPGADLVLRSCGDADRRGAGVRRCALAGVARTDGLRHASVVADRAAGYQRRRTLQAPVLFEPRCGTSAVCGFAGRRGDAGGLSPRDNLALIAMHRQLPCDTGAPAHQEFRTAVADRVGAATARRRLACAFVELRKREQLTPDRPCFAELVAIGADQQRNGERGIAVHEDEGLRLVIAA